jgi:hypothetical protein
VLDLVLAPEAATAPAARLVDLAEIDAGDFAFLPMCLHQVGIVAAEAVGAGNFCMNDLSWK